MIPFKSYTTIMISFIALLFSFLAPEATAATDHKQTLSVIGVSHNLNDSRWDDQLIGYGIAKLVLQGLYDTGLYTSYEDNPEIIQKVKHLLANQWQQHDGSYSPKQASKIAQEIGSDVVAYARITRFSVRRLHGFAGLFAAAKTTIYFDIELHIVNQQGVHRSYQGTGSASTNSTGVLLHIRKDKVYFDQTGVGQAITQAVNNAIGKIKDATP